MGKIMGSLFLKKLFYLIFVLLSVFSIYWYISLPERHWLIWSSLACLFFPMEHSFSRQIRTYLQWAVLFPLLIFITGSLTASTVAITIYLFILMFLISFISQCHQIFDDAAHVFIPSFLLGVLILISAFLPPHEFQDNLYRAFFVLLGMAIPMVWQIIFWPHYIDNRIQYLTHRALRYLSGLQQSIFACFLQPDYSENVYSYERKLHLYKYLFLLTQFGLKNLLGSCKKNVNGVLYLDELFDLSLDMSQLRWRVSDYTIFAVCKQDLTAVIVNIAALFFSLGAIVNRKSNARSKVSQQFLQKLTLLEMSIKKLDETYYNVLQVTSREPLVFFLFLTRLKIFQEKLLCLYKFLVGDGKAKDAINVSTI